MALADNKALDQKGTPSSPVMTLLGAHPVKATTQIWCGSITYHEIASACLVPALSAAAVATTHRLAGVSGKAVLGGAANGDKKLDDLQRGTFMFKNATGGDALTEADKFGRVYAIDDEVVARTSNGATRLDIGEFLGFDPASGDPIVSVGLGQ